LKQARDIIYAIAWVINIIRTEQFTVYSVQVYFRTIYCKLLLLIKFIALGTSTGHQTFVDKRKFVTHNRNTMHYTQYTSIQVQQGE